MTPADMKKANYLRMRLNFLKAFDIRKPSEGYGTPLLAGGEGDFEKDLVERLLKVRDLINMFAATEIEVNFKTKWSERYPNYLFDKGQKVTSTKDFLRAYHDMKDEKKANEMFIFATVQMWEKNYFAEKLECKILDLLRWKYTVYKSDGSRRQRSTAGGTIRGIIVKKKGSMLNALIQEANNKGGRPRVRKCPLYDFTTPLKRKPRKKLRMVKATIEEHGYNGWYSCSEDQSDGSAGTEKCGVPGKPFDESHKLSDFLNFVKDGKLPEEEQNMMTVESVLTMMHQVSVLV